MTARVSTNTFFILIEPQQEMKVWLDAFVGSHPGSVLHCVAAGSENNTLPMTIWPNGDGSSFLLSDEQARALNLVRRDMPVRTIDSLINTAESRIPELAKFDIQGYEIEALKGAQSLLKSTEVIILEVTFFTEPEGADFAAVVRFMDDAGYKLYDFCGFAPRPYDNALGQADAVFVRSSGRFRRHLGWR